MSVTLIAPPHPVTWAEMKLRLLKTGSMPLIGTPLVMASARPWAAVNVTSAMTVPCQKPTAAQITMASRIASGGGHALADIEPGGEDPGETGKSAAGQVDAAGEDDQRFADRDDADLG